MKTKYVRRPRAGVLLVIALVVLAGTPGFLAQAGALSDNATAKPASNKSEAPAVDDVTSLSQSIKSSEAKSAVNEGTAAAYPIYGIIDPDAMTNSGDPGVLVPLAQATSSISHWMEAVDAAGPSTPFSDPSFEGTVFMPNDEAFEAAYPQLSQVSTAGRTAAEVFADLKASELAAQLNSLTVPGVVLKLADLKPGRLLRTSDGEMLKVLGTRSDNSAIKLQHSQSGTTFTVLEPNLQSGNAIGHVIDRLVPPAKVLATATEKAAISGAGGRYASAISVLLDPAQQLSALAKLVEQAGLGAVLADPQIELTLFAPSDKAMKSFMGQLPPSAAYALESNATLADQLVSAHLVAGVALGTKALEALPGGQVKSQAGAVMFVQQAAGWTRPAPVSLTGYVQEQGQLSLGLMLTVDGAQITTSDIIGGQAVVHIIDKVLISIEVAEQLNIPATSLELHVDARISSAASAQALFSATAQLALAAVALGLLI